MVADSRFTPEDPEAMKTVDIISVIFSTGIKFQVCLRYPRGEANRNQILLGSRQA